MKVSLNRFLDVNVTYEENTITSEVNKFMHVGGVIINSLERNTRKDTNAKFYKTMAVLVLLCDCEVHHVAEEERVKQRSRSSRAVKGCAGAYI